MLQNVLNNVGKLKTKGVEVEFSAKPSEWLQLDATAAYTDAKMISFPGTQGYSGQPGTAANCATVAASRLCGFQNRGGASLPNSPKFKFNLGATGEIPFRATVFVNNLFNKHYAGGLANNFGSLGGGATNLEYGIYQVLPRDSERFFGIKLQHKFGD